MRPSPQTVEKKFVAQISSMGFRFKYGIGNWPIDDSFSGWLGLALGTHGDFIRVNPNIGINCHEAMRLLARCDRQKYQHGRYPTVSLSLGEVCPDVRQFIVRNEDDIEAEAVRLGEILMQFAVPFFKNNANLESVTEMLDKATASLGTAPFLYAACLYLKGNHDAALQYIQEQIDRFTQRGLSRQVDEMKCLKSALLH